MSFGINGPTPKFGIQEAQNMKNNGGGGNLGYFRRQKKDKKKNEDDVDVFEISIEDDEFVLEADLSKEKNIMEKASEFINKFKTKRQGA